MNHEYIAEIGTSHLGSVSNAKRLIDAAKDAGAHTVKFQWVIANEIVSPYTGHIAVPTRNIDIYKYFKSVEKPFEFYKSIKDYAESRNLQFLCSVFGHQSLSLLQKLSPIRIKIASPEINYTTLLNAIALYKKKTHVQIILSTGLASLIDIYNALKIITNVSNEDNITILRCVTRYPAELAEYKLLLLLKYKSLFNCTLGISDHSTNSSILASIAAALGSTVTEKHFTLDSHGTSPDDPIALTPSEFSKMVNDVNTTISLPEKERIPYVKRTYGQEVYNECVHGTKNNTISPRPLSWSAPLYSHYHTSRRSLFTQCAVKEGESFTKANCTFLRSEQNIPCGLTSELYPYITSYNAKKTISSYKNIEWHDIKNKS